MGRLLKPVEIREARTWKGNQFKLYKRGSPTGFCITCGAPAEKECVFKLKGISVIQRFCNEHAETARYELN